MKIVLFRIDERLIHGQVAHAWSSECKPNKILVIDDQGVDDPLLPMTLEMATPAGISFSILNTEDAIKYLNEHKNSSERILIVVKSPQVPLDLSDNDIEIQSVNLGGMYYKEGRKKVSKTVYLNDTETDIFKKLQEKGIEVEIRTNPSDKKADLFKFI